MTPYLLLFSVFLMFFFVMETIARNRALTRTECWLTVLPLIIFAVVYAGRIGTDVENYSILFEIAEVFPLEPGFSILMIGAKAFGLDYVEFAKLLTLIQMFLLVFIARRMRDPLFFLLFYFGSFYLNFQFNAIRNSLALLILAAVYTYHFRLNVPVLMSSTMIHYSSLITFMLQRLSMMRRQGFVIAVFVAAAGLFALLWMHPELLGSELRKVIFFYEGYLGQTYATKTIYPALLLKLSVVLLLTRNGGSPFYLWAYAVLVVLIHTISPTLSRVSDIVLFLAVLQFCTKQHLDKHRIAATSLTLLLVASSFMIPWADCQTGGEGRWCLSGANIR